jgi:hypothetical protein
VFVSYCADCDIRSERTTWRGLSFHQLLDRLHTTVHQSSYWRDAGLETQPELCDSTPVYINIAKFFKTRENAEFIMAVPPERRADVPRELAEVERYSLPKL